VHFLRAWLGVIGDLRPSRLARQRRSSLSAGGRPGLWLCACDSWGESRDGFARWCSLLRT